MQKQQQNQANTLKLRAPNGHLSNLVAMILEKIGYALPGCPHRRSYRAMLKENQVEIRISRPMDNAAGPVYASDGK